MHEYTPIIEFWFGAGTDRDATTAGRQSRLWWGKNAETDQEIRRRFEPQVQAAGTGKLEAWKSSPEGWLALILLTDQFPRNIYRDTPRMYRFDPLARTLCADGLEDGTDRKLRLVQRVFFYLPLEHSESLDDQVRCVTLMHGLVHEAPEADKAVFEDFAGHAEAHRNIIERFGRFPHRNSILGRESTDEEIAFLTQPGSSF